MIQSPNNKDVLITLQAHLLNYVNPQKESGNLYLINITYPLNIQKIISHTVNLAIN